MPKNYLKEVRLGNRVIKTLFCGFPAVETCKTTPTQPSRYKKQAPKMRLSFLGKRNDYFILGA